MTFYGSVLSGRIRFPLIFRCSFAPSFRFSRDTSEDGESFLEKYIQRKMRRRGICRWDIAFELTQGPL
jgi:hypothetical protein